MDTERVPFLCFFFLIHWFHCYFYAVCLILTQIQTNNLTEKIAQGSLTGLLYLFFNFLSFQMHLVAFIKGWSLYHYPHNLELTPSVDESHKRMPKAQTKSSCFAPTVLFVNKNYTVDGSKDVFLYQLHWQLSNSRGRHTAIKNYNLFIIFSQGSFNSPLSAIRSLSTRTRSTSVCVLARVFFQLVKWPWWHTICSLYMHVLRHICSIKHHAAGSQRRWYEQGETDDEQKTNGVACTCSAFCISS